MFVGLTAVLLLAHIGLPCAGAATVADPDAALSDPSNAALRVVVEVSGVSSADATAVLGSLTVSVSASLAAAVGNGSLTFAAREMNTTQGISPAVGPAVWAAAQYQNNTYVAQWPVTYDSALTLRQAFEALPTLYSYLRAVALEGVSARPNGAQDGAVISQVVVVPQSALTINASATLASGTRLVVNSTSALATRPWARESTAVTTAGIVVLVVGALLCALALVVGVRVVRSPVEDPAEKADINKPSDDAPPVDAAATAAADDDGAAGGEVTADEPTETARPAGGTDDRNRAVQPAVIEAGQYRLRSAASGLYVTFTDQSSSDNAERHRVAELTIEADESSTHKEEPRKTQTFTIEPGAYGSCLVSPHGVRRERVKARVEAKANIPPCERLVLRYRDARHRGGEWDPEVKAEEPSRVPRALCVTPESDTLGLGSERISEAVSKLANAKTSHSIRKPIPEVEPWRAEVKAIMALEMLFAFQPIDPRHRENYHESCAAAMADPAAPVVAIVSYAGDASAVDLTQCRTAVGTALTTFAFSPGFTTQHFILERVDSSRVDALSPQLEIPGTVKDDEQSVEKAKSAEDRKDAEAANLVPFRDMVLVARNITLPSGEPACLRFDAGFAQLVPLSCVQYDRPPPPGTVFWADCHTPGRSPRFLAQDFEESQLIDCVPLIDRTTGESIVAINHCTGAIVSRARRDNDNKLCMLCLAPSSSLDVSSREMRIEFACEGPDEETNLLSFDWKYTNDATRPFARSSLAIVPLMSDPDPIEFDSDVVGIPHIAAEGVLQLTRGDPMALTVGKGGVEYERFTLAQCSGRAHEFTMRTRTSRVRDAALHCDLKVVAPLESSTEMADQKTKEQSETRAEPTRFVAYRSCFAQNDNELMISPAGTRGLQLLGLVGRFRRLPDNEFKEHGRYLTVTAAVVEQAAALVTMRFDRPMRVPQADRTHQGPIDFSANVLFSAARSYVAVDDEQNDGVLMFHDVTVRPSLPRYLAASPPADPHHPDQRDIVITAKAADPHDADVCDTLVLEQLPFTARDVAAVKRGKDANIRDHFRFVHRSTGLCLTFLRADELLEHEKWRLKLTEQMNKSNLQKTTQYRGFFVLRPFESFERHRQDFALEDPESEGEGNDSRALFFVEVPEDELQVPAGTTNGQGTAPATSGAADEEEESEERPDNSDEDDAPRAVRKRPVYLDFERHPDHGEQVNAVDPVQYSKFKKQRRKLRQRTKKKGQLAQPDDAALPTVPGYASRGPIDVFEVGRAVAVGKLRTSAATPVDVIDFQGLLTPPDQRRKEVAEFTIPEPPPPPSSPESLAESRAIRVASATARPARVLRTTLPFVAAAILLVVAAAGVVMIGDFALDREQPRAVLRLYRTALCDAPASLAPRPLGLATVVADGVCQPAELVGDSSFATLAVAATCDGRGGSSVSVARDGPTCAATSRLAVSSADDCVPLPAALQEDGVAAVRVECVEESDGRFWASAALRGLATRQATVQAYAPQVNVTPASVSPTAAAVDPAAILAASHGVASTRVRSLAQAVRTVNFSRAAPELSVDGISGTPVNLGFDDGPLTLSVWLAATRASSGFALLAASDLSTPLPTGTAAAAGPNARRSDVARLFHATVLGKGDAPSPLDAAPALGVFFALHVDGPAEALHVAYAVDGMRDAEVLSWRLEELAEDAAVAREVFDGRPHLVTIRTASKKYGGRFRLFVDGETSALGRGWQQCLSGRKSFPAATALAPGSVVAVPDTGAAVPATPFAQPVLVVGAGFGSGAAGVGRLRFEQERVSQGDLLEDSGRDRFEFVSLGGSVTIGVLLCLVLLLGIANLVAPADVAAGGGDNVRKGRNAAMAATKTKFPAVAKARGSGGPPANPGGQAHALVIDALSAAQAIDLYFTGWDWPATFQVPMTIVIFLPALDLSLDFFSLPALLTPMLQLLAALIVLVIGVKILVSDNTRFVAQLPGIARKAKGQDALVVSDSVIPSAALPLEDLYEVTTTEARVDGDADAAPDGAPEPKAWGHRRLLGLAAALRLLAEEGVVAGMLRENLVPSAYRGVAQLHVDDDREFGDAVYVVEVEDAAAKKLRVYRYRRPEGGAAVAHTPHDDGVPRETIGPIKFKPVTRCPVHDALLINAVDADHRRRAMEMRTLGFAQPYQCVHKQMPFTDFREGNVCDVDAGFMVCPECNFTVCKNCAALKAKDKAKAFAATKRYEWRDASILLGAIIIGVIEAVYVPILKNAAMIVTCHPDFQCTFPGCYDEPTATFVVAVALSLFVIVAVGLGVPLTIFRLLLRRKREVLRHVFDEGDAAAEMSALDVFLYQTSEEEWAHVLQFDSSVLKGVYATFELRYVMLQPLLVALKLVLVLGIIVSVPESLTQLAVSGAVQSANALIMLVGEPFIDRDTDRLSKVGALHQVALLAFASFYRTTGSDVLAGLMLASSALYLLFLAVVIVRIVRAIKAAKMAARVALGPFIAVKQGDRDVLERIAQADPRKLVGVDFAGRSVALLAAQTPEQPEMFDVVVELLRGVPEAFLTEQEATEEAVTLSAEEHQRRLRAHLTDRRKSDDVSVASVASFSALMMVVKDKRYTSIDQMEGATVPFTALEINQACLLHAALSGQNTAFVTSCFGPSGRFNGDDAWSTALFAPDRFRKQGNERAYASTDLLRVPQDATIDEQAFPVLAGRLSGGRDGHRRLAEAIESLAASDPSRILRFFDAVKTEKESYAALQDYREGYEWYDRDVNVVGNVLRGALQGGLNPVPFILSWTSPENGYPVAGPARFLRMAMVDAIGEKGSLDVYQSAVDALLELGAKDPHVPSSAGNGVFQCNPRKDRDRLIPDFEPNDEDLEEEEEEDDEDWEEEEQGDGEDDKESGDGSEKWQRLVPYVSPDDDDESPRNGKTVVDHDLSKIGFHPAQDLLGTAAARPFPENHQLVANLLSTKLMRREIAYHSLDASYAGHHAVCISCANPSLGGVIAVVEMPAALANRFVAVRTRFVDCDREHDEEDAEPNPWRSIRIGGTSATIFNRDHGFDNVANVGGTSRVDTNRCTRYEGDRRTSTKLRGPALDLQQLHFLEGALGDELKRARTARGDKKRYAVEDLAACPSADRVKVILFADLHDGKSKRSQTLQDSRLQPHSVRVSFMTREFLAAQVAPLRGEVTVNGEPEPRQAMPQAEYEACGGVNLELINRWILSQQVLAPEKALNGDVIPLEPYESTDDPTTYIMPRPKEWYETSLQIYNPLLCDITYPCDAVKVTPPPCARAIEEAYDAIGNVGVAAKDGEAAEWKPRTPTTDALLEAIARGDLVAARKVMAAVPELASQQFAPHGVTALHYAYASPDPRTFIALVNQFVDQPLSGRRPPDAFRRAPEDFTRECLPLPVLQRCAQPTQSATTGSASRQQKGITNDPAGPRSLDGDPSTQPPAVVQRIFDIGLPDKNRVFADLLDNIRRRSEDGIELLPDTRKRGQTFTAWAVQRRAISVLHAFLNDAGFLVDVSLMNGLRATALDGGWYTGLAILLALGGREPTRTGGMLWELALKSNDMTAVSLLVLLNVGIPRLSHLARQTPYHYARTKGAVELLAALNVPTSDADREDSEGWTAVHRTASRGDVDALRVLVANDAHIDTRSHVVELTPEIVAACNNHVEAVAFLRLECGAAGEAASVDARGQTALVHAVRHNAADVVEFLCDVFPGDLLIPDAAGKLPFEWLTGDRPSPMTIQPTGPAVQAAVAAGLEALVDFVRTAPGETDARLAAVVPVPSAAATPNGDVAAKESDEAKQQDTIAPVRLRSLQRADRGVLARALAMRRARWTEKPQPNTGSAEHSTTAGKPAATGDALEVASPLDYLLAQGEPVAAVRDVLVRHCVLEASAAVVEETVTPSVMRAAAALSSADTLQKLLAATKTLPDDARWNGAAETLAHVAARAGSVDVLRFLEKAAPQLFSVRLASELVSNEAAPNDMWSPINFASKAREGQRAIDAAVLCGRADNRECIKLLAAFEGKRGDSNSSSAVDDLPHRAVASPVVTLDNLRALLDEPHYERIVNSASGVDADGDRVLSAFVSRLHRHDNGADAPAQRRVLEYLLSLAECDPVSLARASSVPVCQKASQQAEQSEQLDVVGELLKRLPKSEVLAADGGSFWHHLCAVPASVNVDAWRRALAAVKGAAAFTTDLADAAGRTPLAIALANPHLPDLTETLLHLIQHTSDALRLTPDPSARFGRASTYLELALAAAQWVHSSVFAALIAKMAAQRRGQGSGGEGTLGIAWAAYGDAAGCVGSPAPPAPSDTLLVQLKCDASVSVADVVLACVRTAVHPSTPERAVVAVPCGLRAVFGRVQVPLGTVAALRGASRDRTDDSGASLTIYADGRLAVLPAHESCAWHPSDATPRPDHGRSELTGALAEAARRPPAIADVLSGHRRHGWTPRAAPKRDADGVLTGRAFFSENDEDSGGLEAGEQRAGGACWLWWRDVRVYNDCGQLPRDAQSRYGHDWKHQQELLQKCLEKFAEYDSPSESDGQEDDDEERSASYHDDEDDEEESPSQKKKEKREGYERELARVLAFERNLFQGPLFNGGRPPGWGDSDEEDSEESSDSDDRRRPRPKRVRKRRR